MAQEQYRIVFRGEIAFGFETLEVKTNLGRLCRYDEAMLEKVFSGKTFVLKSGLDQATAAKYKTALDRTGAVCLIEPIPAAAAGPPSLRSASVASAPRPSLHATEARSMTCPKCAATQPESTFCAHCGIAIAKYLAQQNARPEFPYAPADSDPPEAPAGEGWQWVLLSPNGRLNRQPYWLASLGLGLVGLVAFLFLADQKPFVYLGLALLLGYCSLMLYIKRAHDLDRSGHFCWLLLIPIISLWPAIVLGFFKGTDGANRFGADPLGG